MIHHVFANRSNIGDWLSARGIQSLLAPHQVTEHLCDEPFVPETLTRLEALNADDLIIIGGGGLFMDYFEPFWRGFQAIAERVPFVIWGVGCCDMKRTNSLPPASLLHEIVNKSRYCIVRDELTRNYLSHCKPVPAIPCPSMTVVSDVPSKNFSMLYADAYDNIGPQVYEKTIKTLKEYATRTGRKYRQTNNIISQANESQLKQVVEMYTDADLVVASRLHGCILGVAMGRKVLAISGDRKIEAFMHSANLGDWVLNLEQIDQLDERLAMLPDQNVCTDFIVNARRQNEAFAERIKTLIMETR